MSIWQAIWNSTPGGGGGGGGGAVSSVNSQTGAVVLTTDDINEGISNFYYTDARARASISGTAPVSYNSATGVISMHVADSTHNGYLSLTDWTTFNNKMDDPMTTIGDLIYRNGSNVTSRRAIGSSGQVLTVTGGVPVWAAIPAISFPIIAPENIVAYAFSETGTDTGLGSPSDGVTRMFNNGVNTFEWQPGQMTAFVDLNVTNVIYPSTAANLFLASPSGGSGVPTFRAIAQGDIPNSALFFPISAPLGSNSAPSFRFDSDTGMYSAGDGNLSWATNNVLSFDLTTTRGHFYADLEVAGNISAANYPPSGSPNTFAGFSGVGAFESIPNWNFTSKFGLSVSNTYAPAAPDGFTFNALNTSVQQTANNSGAAFNQFQTGVDLDPSDSGFTSGSVVAFSTFVTHRASTSADDITGISANLTLGDGALTGGSAGSLTGSRISLGANGTYSIANVYGVTVDNLFAANTTVGNFYGFTQNTQILGGLTNYTSYNASPSIDSTTINSYRGFQLTPNFGQSTTTAIDGYIGFQNATGLHEFGHINNISAFDDSFFAVHTTTGTLNNYTGFSTHPDVNISTVTNWQAFSENGRFGNDFATSINQYWSINCTPTFRSHASVSNFFGAQISPIFESGSALTGTFYGILFNPALNSGTCSNYSVISSNPNFGNTATFTTSNYFSLQDTPTLYSGSTMTSYNGIQLSPNFQAGSTLGNFNGILINTNTATSLSGQCNGVTVQLDNFTLLDGIKNGLNIGDGALQSSYNFKTSNFPGGIPGFFQVNALGGNFEVSAGSPLTGGQVGFMNNIGAQILFSDDMGVGGIPEIGICVNGFVGQLAAAAGKTGDTLNYMFAGAQVPPMVGDGGTVTHLAFYTAYGLIPAGGNLTVTNMYGFRATPALTSMSPTNSWGFYCDDPNSDNFFKKSVVVGGSTGKPASGLSLDVTGNAGIKDANSLRFYDTDSSNYVAFKSAGTVGSNVTWTLPSADGTAGQVLKTNGSAVLSWVTASGGSANVENFTLNGTDISNGYVTLSSTPSDATKISFGVSTGPNQVYSVDYTLIGANIDWNGLGLDGVLSSGDTITIIY